MKSEEPEREKAERIMKGGLGKAELEFVTSITAPLYWIIREGDEQYKVRNGSAFFLDAGAGPFCVTAGHVIKGWREASKKGSLIALGLGLNLPLDFDGKNRLIAEHDEIDIATFQITPSEIESIKKVILTGSPHKKWPPLPPEKEKGIYSCGFPSDERIYTSPNATKIEVSFGACPAHGTASSVSELDVSSSIERENLIDMGRGTPPENYDFGGISGGPMLTIVDTPGGLRSWSLAGVIYQGPNTSDDTEQAIYGVEIIRARRAHFILPDGTLDIRLWDSLHLSSR